MNNYPHCGIWINGRTVDFESIIKGIAGETKFEENTFRFIKSWLTGGESFPITTSGSTGKPKEISVSRAQMIASAEASKKALDLHADYNALICLDTAYIAGRMMIVRSFVTGMRMFAVDPCAAPLDKIPHAEHIHFTALVPYQIQATLESKHPHLLHRLLTCIVGGAPMKSETIDELQKYTCRFYATYGMTETISHIALQKLNGADRSTDFIALPGVILSTDERSCLTIRTSYLDSEIVTNDVVMMTGPSSFQWRGRWDNVINSGGVKLSPEILELQIGQIFTRLNFNASFFLYGIPDPKLGEKIVMVIEGRDMSLDRCRSLHDELSKELKTYELPKGYYLNPQFTRTDTEKVNRTLSFNHSHSLQE